MSMLLRNKQASRPPHVHTTMQPPSNPQAKLLYLKCTRLNTSLWKKNINQISIFDEKVKIEQRGFLSGSPAGEGWERQSARPQSKDSPGTSARRQGRQGS